MPNIYLRKIFNSLIRNIQFEIKCPFKKGVYEQVSKTKLKITTSLTDGGLYVPSFINYDKEFMLTLTYSTKFDEYSETLAEVEERHKFVDVP